MFRLLLLGFFDGGAEVSPDTMFFIGLSLLLTEIVFCRLRGGE